MVWQSISPPMGIRLSPRFLLALSLLLSLLLQACDGQDQGIASAEAPSFTLPNATGAEVSLSDYVGQKPVLLYFHMAVG